MSDTRLDLPQGTLDLLILKTLALGPQHGGRSPNASIRSPARRCRFARSRSIPRCIGLPVAAGSSRGGGSSDNNRRAKYYQLTNKGHAQLEAEADAWRRLTAAIAQVLETS